jgi:diaminohydroxyphosphoribosylaminopyrimidine deaminase/5-amino-6-(5-phosphoribosylamino)uracil reductase
MFNESDHQHMQRALALARRGLFTTTPNPRVGCVIVKDGVVIGEGWHHRAGEPHAEVHALVAARANVGADHLSGATVYVTLEPCNHFGRTPPCTTALIEARVARIVAAMEDPSPQVSGIGLAALRHAGVDVRCGLARTDAEALNVGFISRMTRGQPWVRMKMAASLDGRTALLNGVSRWITSDEARRDGHAWRARACAVLTGLGTLREDDPQLTVRLVPTSRQPLRVLVDGKLEAKPAARLFDGEGQVLVFTASYDTAKAEALHARGAEICVLPDPDKPGKVDLRGMLRQLGQRGINELHVEAGEALNASLLREHCVDELLVYLAPSLVGPGRALAALPELSSLDDRLRLKFSSVEQIGPDARLLARVLDRSTEEK